MPTATERALKAKANVDSLIKDAIKEQLSIIKEAEQRLAELGYSKSATKTGTRNTDPAKKHCPVCNMGGHDGRSHRGQGKSKRKFTTAELKDLGLT